MSDPENREDKKIRECLQEAFGYSDEQLLKQLDHANQIKFDGAEDRLMKRFMERKAELEKKSADRNSEAASWKQSGSTDETRYIEKEITEKVKKEPAGIIKGSEEAPTSTKKLVRFGKKKILATAALVAVIAGMLGGTAIGKRNLFLKKSGEVSEILLDNARNKVIDSELEKIYAESREKTNIPILKLGYFPNDMLVKDFEIYSDGVQIRFLYQHNVIYIIQSKKAKTISTAIESDRVETRQVFNKWINQNIDYKIDNIEDNAPECEALIVRDNYFYYIAGRIQEAEFVKILEYLNFL